MIFWWQPLTTMFCPWWNWSFGMNMFVLWQFGNLIERVKGAKELVFYI